MIESQEANNAVKAYLSAATVADSVSRLLRHKAAVVDNSTDYTPDYVAEPLAIDDEMLLQRIEDLYTALADVCREF